MDKFMQAAIDEAKLGLAEGGIPIGSVLVHNGEIIGRGHNKRVQSGSPILHGEMDALENAVNQHGFIKNRRFTPHYHLAACAAVLFYFTVSQK